MITSTLSPSVHAVLDTYPEELRTLLIDSNSGEFTPGLPALPAIERNCKDSAIERNCKDLTQKSATKSTRNTTRRRASIRARLNEYVCNYSADLQILFNDIVAAAQSESCNNSNSDSGGAQHQTDQSLKDNLAVYGAQYLKERLQLMQKRSKVSVMPLLKKCTKANLKRKSRASLIHKLEILRKQFQLLKKNDPSVVEPKRNYLSKINKLKAMKKKRKISSKCKTNFTIKSRKKVKKMHQQKTKKTSRNTNATSKKIRKRSGVLA